MREQLRRGPNKLTEWLDTRTEDMIARRARQAEVAGAVAGSAGRDAESVLGRDERLCPRCVFIFDDRGQVIEVIDCQTNQHHVVK
ncbi:hypothetical protein [Arthrobacter sp. JCM 19049]|uniref:hypothetical protein n=1 Tax=Arthrobacter sp. JCM 19049 TaxID=1460643 RepID=UPI0006D23DA4|nr:hypothetical protein [Arthrobacter sp. JCM 19049]